MASSIWFCFLLQSTIEPTAALFGSFGQPFSILLGLGFKRFSLVEFSLMLCIVQKDLYTIMLTPQHSEKHAKAFHRDRGIRMPMLDNVPTQLRLRCPRSSW